MRIGETDIFLYHAKQQRVTFEHNGFENDSEWDYSAVIPYLADNHITFKTIVVTLLVKGDSREDIIGNCSGILSLLLQPVELTLDGFNHQFKVILGDHRETETVMNRWHLLELTFHGYEHDAKSTIEVSRQTSFTVMNEGNVRSPCIVEITPLVGAATITLTGICRDSFTGKDMPVTIPDLETGKTVIIDGVAGLITQGGEPKDIDAWALPSLIPGSNAITCDNSYMTIKVTVVPIYL